MSGNFQRWRGLLICLGLTVLVAGVYWPVCRFEFVNLDDPVYVTDNPHVRGGLTWAGLTWALGSWEAEFWHPLTWLSHMADVAVYGLKPGGHHLTNLLLHLASTLMVFLVFRRLTRTLWRSGLVAGLFGLHPLHVETVAWVADRKDLLSGLFWWLTVWAYGRYVEASKGGRGRKRLWYGLGLVFFVLGLMSKPMVVTLPFVLLLLDLWPLRRWELSTLRSQLPVLRRLVWEKVPYWVVTGVGSVLAYVVQERGGGLASVAQLPVWGRVGNALVSYVRYMGKTVWPGGLAVHYPHPGHWPSWAVVGSCLVVVAITGVVGYWVRKRPYLGVGWLWYVGTLVPVIGLVQVGSHALADRYTYIPLVGLFVIGVWGVGEVEDGWRVGKMVAAVLGMVVTVGCAGWTWIQLQHWRNSVALFEHALAVTHNNYRAHDSLGVAFSQQGRVGEAIGQYEQALRIMPQYREAHQHLGIAMFQQGRYLEAIEQHELVLRLKPNHVEAHNSLGIALVRAGRVREGIVHLERAVLINPDYAEAHDNLGFALVQAGRVPEAVPHLERALQLKPGYANAHDNLGIALYQLGQLTNAVAHYQQALRLKPGFAEAHNNLAAALVRLGRVPEAIVHLEEALRLNPAYSEACYNLAQGLFQLGDLPAAAGQYERLLRLRPDAAKAHAGLGKVLLQQGRAAEAMGHFEQVLRYTPGNSEARNNLGVALFQLGRMHEAIGHLEEALRVNPDDGVACYNLARVLLQLGRIPEAREKFEHALRVNPGDTEALNDLAWLLATSRDESVREGERAVKLAGEANRLAGGKDPWVLNTLAAAYAEAGKFDESVRTARAAIELARGARAMEMAEQIRGRLQSYESGQPWREGATPTPGIRDAP